MTSKITVQCTQVTNHTNPQIYETAFSINTLNYVYYIYFKQIGVMSHRLLTEYKQNCITETPTAASRDSQKQSLKHLKIFHLNLNTFKTIRTSET